MAISPIGSSGGGASAYQAVQAAQQAAQAKSESRHAPSVTNAPEAPKPERADRVTLSGGARPFAAYESLRETSRVIQNDTVAAVQSAKSQTAIDRLRQQGEVAAQDRSGQVASRLHVVA